MSSVLCTRSGTGDGREEGGRRPRRVVNDATRFGHARIRFRRVLARGWLRANAAVAIALLRGVARRDEDYVREAYAFSRATHTRAINNHHNWSVSATTTTSRAAAARLGEMAVELAEQPEVAQRVAAAVGHPDRAQIEHAEQVAARRARRRAHLTVGRLSSSSHRRATFFVYTEFAKSSRRGEIMKRAASSFRARRPCASRRVMLCPRRPVPFPSQLFFLIIFLGSRLCHSNHLVAVGSLPLSLSLSLSQASCAIVLDLQPPRRSRLSLSLSSRLCDSLVVTLRSPSLSLSLKKENHLVVVGELVPVEPLVREVEVRDQVLD